jgi:hypothetical protein
MPASMDRKVVKDCPLLQRLLHNLPLRWH